MSGKSLSEKQKRAARAKRGEDPKGSSPKTKGEYVPPMERFKQSSPNQKIVTVAIVIICLLALAVIAFLFISAAGSKGAADAAIKFSNDGPTPPQSYILPALRHLAEAGSSFY